MNFNHSKPKFKQLYHLMQLHQLSAPDLVRKMIAMKIILADPDDETYINNVAGQIRKQLQNYESAEKLKGFWIDRYCKVFGCSADYLFGYIDNPTYPQDVARKALGLSEEASARLETLGRTNHLTGIMDTLSVIIEDRAFPDFTYAVYARLSLPGGDQTRFTPLNPFASFLDPDIFDNHQDEKRDSLNYKISAFYTDDRLKAMTDLFIKHNYDTMRTRSISYMNYLYDKYGEKLPDRDLQSDFEEYCQLNYNNPTYPIRTKPHT